MKQDVEQIFPEYRPFPGWVRVRRHLRFVVCCPFLCVFLGPVGLCDEKPVSFETLGKKYSKEIRPLLSRYCLGCHSTKKKEGELDLERFVTLAAVRRGTRSWLKVVEMLDNGEMPPKGAPQLTARDRKGLRAWVERYLHAEAIANAGDPGPVVLRRLNNAEYTYTVRDLTGVKLDPAREFPSEGAAGEGFTNAGNALVMSPALLRKYLDAGKEISRHAVLLPDGIRFSPKPTRRDWTDEILAKIRGFYGEFVDTVRLESHYGDPRMAHLGNAGQLPLARYFTATLAERDALGSGQKTILEVATARGLNARYLELLWSTLNGDARSACLDDVRVRWRAGQEKDAAALAARVAAWQKGLWTFSPVGLLGKKGARSRWLEKASPLPIQQEFRLKVPLPKDRKAVKHVLVSLVVTDAGDGNEQDFVLWKRPRLVVKGKPDILLRDVMLMKAPPGKSPDQASAPAVPSRFLDASMFGKHPDGGEIEAASICVQAPLVITVGLPVDVVEGRELVTTATLDPRTGTEGSAQVSVVTGTPVLEPGLLPSEVVVTYADVNIGADSRVVTYKRPVLVAEKSKARRRFESDMDDFRQVFPAAVCYTQIVPVDEILTLTLFYREDDQLVRLMLDQAQTARLDRLWDELRYVSHEPFRLVDVLDSLLETTLDHPQAGIFDSLAKPFKKRADAFRRRMSQAEPSHLDALVALAGRAWRRPLADQEEVQLRGLYRTLRQLGLKHDEAFRLTMARVFVASPFLYRIEEAPEGAEIAPVSDGELASRLSYFLWSSLPDTELRSAAAAGSLGDRKQGGDEELRRQTRRLLQDPRVRRLATEFACQWLHIHEFDPLEKKSKTFFPEFEKLRGDMYEESIRFFTDLFRHDGSLLSLLDADHTFVNERLAKFYGIPGVKGPAWRRVDGIRQQGRGGILGLATTLAKQSGATRTSPILRGNWVSEVLLGEKLPRPPKNVPQLVDAIPAGLTERQLIERHSSDAACAKCHARIDPFGFALENFDAIGRRRQKNREGLVIDARTTLPDRTSIEGIDGLRGYLLEKRREAFLRQFCRKLLGYALGRELQLSDRPLIEELLVRLGKNEFRFSVAVETIVTSKQFRTIRGISSNR